MKALWKFACGMVLVGAAQTLPAQLPNIATGPISVELQAVATGLNSVVDLVTANDGTGRLFIVEQGGRIRILQNGTVAGTPFLDIANQIDAGGEKGLLGFAFHPGFANPGSPGFRRLYTYSTQTPAGSSDFTVPMSGSPDNRCVVTEWQVSPSNGNEVDLSSRRDVLRIAHPQRNHNGGKIAFRPSDRYLYIAIGDGGNANDVGDGHTPNLGNAQDLSRLLGKILRIDPLAPPQNPGSADPLSGNGRYRNPASNPFLNGGGLAEIYAYGFRNPYRFSFDATADRLLVGDVGQNTIEEVDLVQIGRNYGWNRKEGSFLFHPGSGSVSPDPNPDPTLVNPVFQYDHGDGISVIGGSVYRGSALPALSGKYVFGDFLKPSIGGGRLFYGDLAEGVIRELRVGGNPRALNFQIRAFGSDAANELYILAENAGEGQVLKIVPIPAAPAFLNLSSRARVKADDLGFAIAGFIVTGSVPKDFVLRGVGPSLTVDGQPVAGRLADPTLLLQDSNGTPITTNDDWMNGPRQGEIFNLGLAPSHPKESAIIATLQPGAYTATMRGVSGGTGIGVVEIFDVARNQPANAVNLSTRADVGAGDNVLIGGLIIGGGGNQRLIARAIGPSLASTRIPTPLQNPTLELVNASGMRIAFNDNWQSDQRDEIIASGLAPADDAESAIIMNLAPASYTAIVRGVGETGGVGLVEFFRLNP